VSDIDIAVVDSLKALDPKRPIREADIGQRRRDDRSNPCADCDVIVCYGGAKLADMHLPSTVRCVDEEIIGWLKRREQRRLG
jgi:hypothetical protein